MMAGVGGNGVEQPRIDKVQIIHAGEDIKRIIQPLAVLLEEKLKLGEQVDYRRHFKQDTCAEVAKHIEDSISNGSDNKGMVFVLSGKFNDVISKFPAVLDSIKTILSPDMPERSKLKVAMVTLGGFSAPFSKLPINLSSYVAELDDGALAEAIYKQWFGPEAQLTSQADVSRNGPVNSDAAYDGYAPCKVKIIHAMQDPATKTHQRQLSDAIDTVVDPEETTSSRIKFISDQSIARTVLGDLEYFQCCSRVPKVHAVFVWCEVMLNALKQDQEAKKKVVDIVCRDISQQKLYAHFLVGVTRQEISTFSQALSEFLTKHGHIVILESLNFTRPVNYEPFAKTFLRIWAGSIKVPKDPEESLDPTMGSLDSAEFLRPLLTSQKPLQSHPHQNNKGDRLVMNNGSISQSEAVRTQQISKGLAHFSAPQGMMVTSNGSLDPQLEKVMNDTRKFQSDNFSNPPENLNRHQTLHGTSFMANSSLANQEAAPVRQPENNAGGKSRMATGSIDSVSVNVVTGLKTNIMKTQPISSEPSDRSAYSLPPSGGQQKPIQQKGQQPSSRVPGEHYGKNKVAASGFKSWSVCGSSTMSQVGVDQQANSGAGLSDPSPGDNLSVGDNPVRIVSDSYALTSADAHQLDDALKTLPTASLDGTPLLRSDFQSLSNSDITGSASVVQSEYTGTQTLPSSTNASSWTSSQGDGSQTVPIRQPGSIDRIMSAPEGRNPLQDAGACSSCGSVSLPYPGANGNAGQNILQSVSSTNSVQSQAGFSLQQHVHQVAPEDTLLSDLDQVLIKNLKIRLDPPKQTVADWQDLASHFGVGNVLITYWKGQKSDSSPFEQLLTWLKAEKQHLTVKDLKILLEKVKRRDVLRFLESKGF